MANHQTNFTSNFGEMGETGNAAFVLNVNGVSHTYHPIGSDVSVDVATVRRILATAPDLAQSIATVLSAGGYPILVYDGSEYGYIKTANNRYVFTCLDSLNGVKQAEVDTQDGTITAGTGGVDGVSILSRTDSDLFLKITTVLALGRIPIVLDNGAYYHLIAKTGTVAQFGRITAAGALEVLTVNSSDQITSASFTFVQDPYYVHTDNNFTNEYKAAVDANTTARHTHANKSILDSIEQTDIDNWNDKLGPAGNASDATSTFTKASGDASSMTSGSKLFAIFTAISIFFASLKALAFKDTASYGDLSSGVQSSLDKADTALQSHQSVTDNNPTLTWGATSTVGTVGSTNLQVTMPSNPASGKQDTISDLSTIRIGAAAGATALQPSGDGSNLSVTPDGTSTGYDLGSSTTLKAFAQKFKNLVGALKALAFKVSVGTSDIDDGAITAAKVKNNETLPVNISGSADRLKSNGLSEGILRFAFMPDNNAGYKSIYALPHNWMHYSAAGGITLTIGNNGGDNTAERRGSIGIGNGQYIGYLRSTNLTSDRYFQLPDVGGTLPVSPAGGVGSASIPVYVGANGQVQPCLLSLPSTTEYIDVNVSSDDLVIEDGHVYVFSFTNASGGSVVRRLFCTSTTADVRAQIVIKKDAPGASCCFVDIVYDSSYGNTQSVASYNVSSNNAGIVLNLHGRRMTINNVTYDYFEVTKQEGYLQ